MSDQTDTTQSKPPIQNTKMTHTYTHDTYMELVSLLFDGVSYVTPKLECLLASVIYHINQHYLINVFILKNGTVRADLLLLRFSELCYTNYSNYLYGIVGVTGPCQLPQ